jgi:Rha family phage regulatory protein
MNDLSEFVTLRDTTLSTDSRRVAKHFKKAHKGVLRACDNLKCSEEFRQRNFAPRDFIDSRGKQQRELSMSKDGFVMLAMGFTGKDAMAFKEAFINAFNGMADQLLQISDNLWAQRLDLEKRDASSFMWASFGAKRMQERRYEKPRLDNERAILDSEIQPLLFQMTKAAA